MSDQHLSAVVEMCVVVVVVVVVEVVQRPVRLYLPWWVLTQQSSLLLQALYPLPRLCCSSLWCDSQKWKEPQRVVPPLLLLSPDWVA